MGQSIIDTTTPLMTATDAANVQRQGAVDLASPMILGKIEISRPASPTSVATPDLSAPLSVSSSSSKQPQQQQRHVHFNDQVICHEIEPYRDCWLSETEFRSIKDASIKKVAQYKQVVRFCGLQAALAEEAADTEEWTWRGLEYVLYGIKRKQSRQEHASSVVHFQKVLGFSSNLALADYASNNSTANGSVVRALENALRDQQQVQAYYQQEEQEQQDNVTVAEEHEQEPDEHHEQEDEATQEQDEQSQLLEQILQAPTSHTISSSTRIRRTVRPTESSCSFISALPPAKSSCQHQLAQPHDQTQHPAWRLVRKFFHCI